MRTSFLLLSAALVLAACDDAAETTAPRLQAAGPSAAADVPPGPNASAKPTAGFSTVTSVQSAQVTYGALLNGVGWPTSGSLAMTCPAGTQVIGGGYDVTGPHPQDIRVYASKPDGANGWKVTVENVGFGASNAHIKVTATCIK